MITVREIMLGELIDIALDMRDEKAFMFLSENLIEMNERMGAIERDHRGGISGLTSQSP